MDLEKSGVVPAAGNVMRVVVREGESPAAALASAMLEPGHRHGAAAAQLGAAQFGRMECAPGSGDYAEALARIGGAVRRGDLALASDLLAAQALTLDGIFTEMARRMALAHVIDGMAAAETYARIAMKAQAQSRATLEALAQMHQPREQTVRRVEVSEGGQAIVADHFHHHAANRETAGGEK